MYRVQCNSKVDEQNEQGDIWYSREQSKAVSRIPTIDREEAEDREGGQPKMTIATKGPGRD